MAKPTDIETARPHRVFAATLELARTNGDEELLGVTAWLIIQMQWKEEHAELIAEAVEDFYDDPCWFITGPEGSEDPDAEKKHAQALDASMSVVLLNQLMLHLDGDPHWHIEPPHESWSDPEWRHSTDLTPEFTFLYQADFDNDLSENELDTVYTGIYNGPIDVFIPDEVADTRWTSMADLEEEIDQYPERFTPWFKIIVDELIRRDAIANKR